MTNITQEMVQKLDEATQEALVPADLRAEGWRYVDPPTKFSPEMWDFFCDLIGRDEYRLLICSEGHGSWGPWKRGQFVISPQGMTNLADKERRARLQPSPQLSSKEHS